VAGLSGPALNIVSALTAGFFLVTFLVYWYLGPQETPYLHHVNQANNYHSAWA
jgi:hypothetical protein